VPQVPPNFLWSLVALAIFMRLSSPKAAHVVVGWSHVQEIRVAKAYLGRKRRAKPHNRFKLSVKLNPFGAAEPSN
jgi:hypothetical protein